MRERITGGRARGGETAGSLEDTRMCRVMRLVSADHLLRMMWEYVRQCASGDTKRLGW